jgi:hypothetical protein
MSLTIVVTFVDGLYTLVCVASVLAKEPSVIYPNLEKIHPIALAKET